MGFNIERFNAVLRKLKLQLDHKQVTPIELMATYKETIAYQDFEAAEAITVTLERHSLYTADTHQHIPALKDPNLYKKHLMVFI